MLNSEANGSELIPIAGPGGYQAVISTRGGSLEELSVHGQPLVESNAVDPEGTRAAGLILAPWPNRLADGRFTWKGVEHRVPITEPQRQTALHGLVHTHDWQVAERAPHLVTLTTDIPSWPAHIAVTYTLEESGLRVEVTATTTAESVPFAWGWHPYITALGAPLGECSLHLDAAYALVCDERLLPTGETQPVAAVLASDLRGLDHAFKVAAGSVVRLENSAGHGAELALGPGLEWLQIYTTEDYPGRGRAIALEPMSAPPNALVTGEDVEELTPGGAFTRTLTVSYF